MMSEVYLNIHWLQSLRYTDMGDYVIRFGRNSDIKIHGKYYFLRGIHYGLYAHCYYCLYGYSQLLYIDSSKKISFRIIRWHNFISSFMLTEVLVHKNERNMYTDVVLCPLNMFLLDVL